LFPISPNLACRAFCRQHYPSGRRLNRPATDDHNLGPTATCSSLNVLPPFSTGRTTLERALELRDAHAARDGAPPPHPPRRWRLAVRAAPQHTFGFIPWHSAERLNGLSGVAPTRTGYAGVPHGGSLLILDLRPIGDMASRIAQQKWIDEIIGVDLVDERLTRARPRCIQVIDLRDDEDDLADVVRGLTDGRGPDSVIDAVGMEAHVPPASRSARAQR